MKTQNTYNCTKKFVKIEGNKHPINRISKNAAIVTVSMLFEEFILTLDPSRFSFH